MFPYISMSTLETINKISCGVCCHQDTLYYNKDEDIYFKFDKHGFLHSYKKVLKDGVHTITDKILSKDNEFTVKGILDISEDECNAFFANPLVVSECKEKH